MIVDLFAGPGGWDLAARDLGLDPIGVELDPAACATRRAAGLRTVWASVTDVWCSEPIGGLIASPPCPTFSTAGKGEGVAELPWLHAAIERWAKWGWSDDLRTLHDWSDPRTPLVLEPLRWIDQAEPEWVAFEQVPPVLPLWEQIAAGLQHRGWGAWAGVLCAADYGVPQKRYRAFVLAHRDRQVTPPEPTHAEHPAPSLFSPQLLPWVTMAEALGWRVLDGPISWCWERPATTVAGDPRLSPPGWRGRPEDYSEDGTYSGSRSMDDAVRLTEAEAAILQSFPPDYPWQGNKSERFQQIGNAVPPMLARAALEAVVS